MDFAIFDILYLTNQINQYVADDLFDETRRRYQPLHRLKFKTVLFELIESTRFMINTLKYMWFDHKDEYYHQKLGYISSDVSVLINHNMRHWFIIIQA